MKAFCGINVLKLIYGVTGEAFEFLDPTDKNG
jgi:hypothetical protein